jgi:hypothetical protein
VTEPTDHEHDTRSLEVLVAGLAGAASDLAQVGRELLVQSVLTRVQRIVIAAVLFFLVIGTGVSVVVLGILLNNSSQAADQRAQQNSLSRTIVDCTQPGGTCYERAQTQTAALVAQLNSATLIAVECADAHNGNDAISDCVTRRLKEHP